MKKTFTLLTLIAALGVYTYAADQIVKLEASELIPHDEGYFIYGVVTDDDGDGVASDFHNQCQDYWEDEDHSDGYQPQLNYTESGEQQGFTYEKCMIMPTCLPKLDAEEEQIVKTGFIAIPPTEWAGKDTTARSLAYILTPQVSNVEYLTIETSGENSIQAERKLPYNIDYSTDGGTTWSDTYIQDYLTLRGGMVATYDTDHPEFGLAFDEMIAASAAQPIIFRIMTNDYFMNDRPISGQVIRVHYLEIGCGAVGINDTYAQNDFNFSVSDKSIQSNELFSVYSIVGQLIGEGTQVTVPQAGIYLIKSDNNNVQKVYIQ